MSGCLVTIAGQVPGMCGFPEDTKFRLALVSFGWLHAGFNGMAPGYLLRDSGVSSGLPCTIGNRRKAELYLKTTTGQVLGRDCSTVQRRNSLTNRKAQTCASMLVRILGSDSEERIEYLLQSLFGDTTAFILRGNGDHWASEIGDICNIHFHNPSSRRMFQRIAHNVLDTTV
jgi:hypothetical protein